MLSDNEQQVRDTIVDILSRMEKRAFNCRERKSAGHSSIGKPADLEVFLIGDPDRAAVAVEVANVNATQLVGEVTRLYCDCCPVKLLILLRDHTPIDAEEQCEKLFGLLYGQKDICHTPARVEWYDKHNQLEKSLKELLQR